MSTQLLLKRVFFAKAILVFALFGLAFVQMQGGMSYAQQGDQTEGGSGSSLNYLPVVQNGDKTLTICLGSEPLSLYPYASPVPNTPALNVLEAVYDGPMDLVSFEYQPVILQKIPSLADGDAALQTVQVQAGDTIADIDKNPVLLEAGVEYFPSGCNQPDCALIYDGVSDVMMDQVKVTYALLPDLVWSDGTPLTASDSVYSFNLAADPDTPYNKAPIDRTASYEAIDDLHIQWVGLPGYIDEHFVRNFWEPYPEHVWGSFTSFELLTAPVSSETPMGWGPYVIDAWTHGSHIALSKNPNYFRADEGLPYFDQLIYKFIGNDPNIAIEALLSGECDILDRDTALFTEGGQVLSLQEDGLLKGYFPLNLRVEYANFGIVPASYDDGYDPQVDRPDFFGDVRTRRAIAMCMDRQSVVDTVYFGQSILASTYLHPFHPLYNSVTAEYPFDVEAASTLLDEVGWMDMDSDGIREWHGDPNLIPTDTPLSFNYWTTNSTQRQQATQIFADSLDQCGIQVNLTYWESGPFFASGADGPVFGRNFDMAQFTWGIAGDVIPCDLWLTTTIPDEDNNFNEPNVSGYSNPDYDAFCGSTLNMLPGQPAYSTFHLTAQEIFADDLPAVPLYFWLDVMATRMDIVGFLPDSSAPSEMWNIESFDRIP